MNRKHWLIIILTLLYGTVTAQPNLYLTDRFSKRANSDQIIAGGYGAFFMTLAHDKWQDMKKVSGSGLGTDYKIKSVQDIIRLGVNHDTAAAPGAFRYQINLRVDAYKYSAPTTAVTTYPSLKVSFDPDSLDSYQDLSVYKFSGYDSFKVSIASIVNLNTGGFVVLGSFARNLYMEAEIAMQRYDLTPVNLATRCDAEENGRRLAVKWNLYTSSAPCPLPVSYSVLPYKPVSYELEWTYIDDYQYDLNTGNKSYAFGISSTIPYDFRRNSTRILVNGNLYRIPMVYEHGALVYRVRTVRPDSVNYKGLVYGAWSLPDSGTTLAANASCFPAQGYRITSGHTSDSLNWQYNINFAEEGKYKNVINYYDGALKDRQTQTRINTDTSYTVLVDKVYDYEGRPALSSLPTPVFNHKNLYYRKDLLLNQATGKAYTAADFDILRCGLPDSIVPLSNAAMANIYYSSLNTDKTGMQKYVPDAKGYPMVQTMYSPDNTNKVLYQGGAGRELQLWKGHATQYEYARPMQEEIDRLLGTEAGKSAFYPKQVVTDPNGQASFSIMDQEGKVVASGLQGDGPDTSKVPVDSLVNFARGKSVCSDLLREAAQDRTGDGINAATTLYNDNKANTSFKYSVATFPFPTGCNSKYLWAKADYNYTITNDCGTDAVNSSGSAGKDSVSSVNGSAYSAGSTITVSNMPKGKYQVNKQLSFSSRNIRRQVDSFVKANEPTCYNDQKYFVRKAVEAAVFPCNDTAGSPRTPCDLLKQKMMRELYPGGRYGQYYTDSTGSFTYAPANSIFSNASGVMGLKPINASGTASDTLTSLNAGERDLYWTFSYDKVNYAPAIVYDHPWRSAATARFISSDNWERAASLLYGNAKPPEPDGHTFFKAMINIDSSVVLDSVVLANFAMDGDYVKMLINDTMVFDYSVGWLLGIPRKLPYLKYGINKIEFYIHNSVGPMAFYSLIATKKQGYRYQDICVNMPESITSGGYEYGNLKGLPQDVFIRIFNDQIAEALLPLHPEYCKLQLCNDGGAFEEKLDNIETWQQAVAANLFHLDSITKQDPIKGVGSGGPERLKRLRGISTRMDTLALQQAYCGAGNGEEKAYCTAFNYKTQIDNFTFVNDTVRQNYFDILRAAYLGNRGLVLRELYDSVNNTCPSCAARRMTLVTPPAPVFTPLDSLLSKTYDWTGQSTGPDSDNADASGDMPDWIKELYRKAKNKDSSGMSSVPPGVSDSMAMVNNTLNTIQADALISHLQNCSLNPVTLARIRSSAMNVLGSGKKLTPQIVKSIITDTAALTLNDLCHPFLVAYDFLPDRTDLPANYACGDAALYNGLLSFLQRSQVLAEINTAPALGAPGWTTSSGSFALSGANAYESQLGATATVTAVLENVPSVCSGCYVSLYIAGATRTDTLHIIAQKSGTMPNLQGRLSGGGGYTLSAVRCLSDDPQAMVSGLVARQTAILDASCSLCIVPSRYYIWSRKTNFMTPAPSAASLANAITCPDLKNALDSFKADTVLYKYTEATNHPLFENTLTNYLNYKLGKKYKYSDYSRLMEGCAVTDKVTLKQFLASYRIQLNSDVNAETFITGLNNLGTLRPRYVRYKSTADTSPVLLIDFNSIGQDTLLAYKSWIDGYSGSGVLSRSYNYSDANNNTSLVFSRSSCGFTPGTYAPVATTTSNVSVWEGEGYNSGYKLHTFRLSSGTALDEANLVASVQAYLYGGTADPICNSGYNFFGRTLLRSDDYGSTLKQQYLSYVYSLGTNHSVVIAGIDPTGLGSHLASYSSGYNFTYDNPYCAGSRNSVYAYKTSPATGADGYNLVKNTILPSVGSLLFPNKDTTLKTPLAGNALTVIRKANGDYWYRYFDATNTLYNVYISSPNRGLGLKPELYSFVSVSMGADARTFTVMVSNGTNSIRCRGYADFDLSTSSVVARNVILDQGKYGISCFDSLDCEYGVMANAILNGKAAYALYFDSTTTRISKNMMAHLLSTTKDSLVYCGTRQQYQYTLYYYDQAGNLTRTVPPEGVRTIAEGSLASVKDTRNGVGGSPDTKLTSHQKQSVYRYNALNQLVYQQTPDGGITYFFYDAAGRQRFSQNSRQRPLGLYTYSLYDGQGRPMETGEVKLSCDKTTDLLFDTSYCDYYTPAGVLYKATHPDFVARAYDNANYPDDTLNRYVRSRQRQEVVRTVYDTTIKVILVAGGASLPLDGLSTEHLDAQQNLRSRVSAIMYYPNIMSGVIAPEQPQFGTYYSYDYNGNVKTINHDFPTLNAQGQRFKRIDYDYDLISGKINMLSHNRNRPDQFYQRYSYDADNRITGVETSHDGLIWNKDAAYTYYKHGPLATVKIGDKIQSMEYAYTVQGWLKAINTDVLNTAKDMGRNGAAGDLTYSRDVLAHALHYFQDDYKQISTTAGETAVNLPQPAKSLYNGNITQQTTGIGGLGTLQRNYRYDQLQRLKSAVNANVNDATAALAATPLNLYRSSYSYDMDGNILGLRRYNGGVTPGLIDNFAYSYDGGGNNNKLLRVFDTVTTTGGGNDLQHGQAPVNYIYDKTGNLVFDQQGAERITWDHFGKVKTIKDTISNRFINFVYDGKGNRIFKEVSKTGSTDDRSGEYYVRDATGNILSVYRTHSVFNKWSVITGYTASVSTTGLISLADLLRPLKNTSFPVGLTSEILSSHSGWVDAYTTRPVSYYLAADAGLKASLLFSGSSWIDDLRSADLGNNTTVWRQTMMDAGPDMVPMFQAALNLQPEGTRLLEQFSMNMPVPVCANLWMMAGQQYMPGNHTMNANNLYAPLSMDPGMRNMVGQEISNNLMNDIPMNGGVNSAAFYDAVVADNSLFLSPALRGQQGQWTGQLSNIVNQYTPVGVVGNFFDTWPGGQGALTAATTPSYRLGIVYNAGPDQVFNDMLGEATEPDINNILTGMTDFTPAEYASLIVSAGAASATDLYTRPGVLNDTISLAEHHIYGNSRLGVQRCDSLALSNNRANSTTRFDLNRQVPWYSYTFDDRIDSTKKEPYGTAGNTDNSIFNNSRYIGLKYYELTDHLGNVLATVLDRKTGKVGGTPGLYDRWVADIASTTDYYPGGMMMPGRNTEYSWSRMGAQGQLKDDEIYGKGNTYAFKHRMEDARIIRFFSPDPLHSKYPYNSDYAFSENRLTDGVEFEGLEYIPYMEKVKYEGKATDYFWAIENGIRGAVNLIPAAWNGLVNSAKAVSDGTYGKQLGGELQSMKNAASAELRVPLKQQLKATGNYFLSPQALEDATSLAVLYAAPKLKISSSTSTPLKLPGTPIPSQNLVTIGTIEDDVMEFSAKVGDQSVQGITNFVVKNDKLYLTGLHLQGSSAGNVGRTAMWDMAKDLGRQQGVSEVIIQGGRRTTGKYKGTVPSPVTIKVD